MYKMGNDHHTTIDTRGTTIRHISSDPSTNTICTLSADGTVYDILSDTCLFKVETQSYVSSMVFSSSWVVSSYNIPDRVVSLDRLDYHLDVDEVDSIIVDMIPVSLCIVMLISHYTYVHLLFVSSSHMYIIQKNIDCEQSDICRYIIRYHIDHIIHISYDRIVDIQV